jgi:hypothetical protein
MKWTKHLTLTIEVEEGEDIKKYVAEVKVTMSHDSDYGADADGNRSVPMDFIDDIEIERVTDEDGKEVTIKEYIRQAVNDRVDDADLSSDEPDYDED